MMPKKRKEKKRLKNDDARMNENRQRDNYAVYLGNVSCWM